MRESLSVRNETAVLVKVILPRDKVGPVDSLAELESLAEAAGATVVAKIMQSRRTPHSGHYVGRGKAEEISEQVKHHRAAMVIFDNDLSPGQIRELEGIIDCKILDRSEVILDIFASRARSAEAKLQVDLAQLQYTYPRLTRMWSHLDTVVGAAGGGGVGAVGGIGTRGTGEKQLEIDRRIVSKRVAALNKQIRQIDARKQRQVRKRSNRNFTVSLVGYTNSGKSTLLNSLTDANTYVADKLFATLDTKTTQWRLSNNLSVLLSDTVGFVRDLPHHLVASFRATLEEAIHADLLLHVVDVSNPLAEQQIEAVNSVLAEMGCQDKNIVMLLNKTDMCSAGHLETMSTLYAEAVPISACTGYGINRLTDIVTDMLTGPILRLRVTGSSADGRIRNYLKMHGTILYEDYEDSRVVLEAHLGSKQLVGLQQLKPGSCEVIAGAGS